MPITRRDTLLMMSAATALSLCSAGIATAKEGDRHDIAKLMTPAGDVPEHTLGDAAAPVTVIEYLSPTCPHCATFALNVFPQFKSAYVDTGKVLFYSRPFVRNILDAVVFLLAEAAGPESYHDVIDSFFKTQGSWSTSEKPKDAMLAVAMQLGFTAESFDAALTNQTLFDGMEAMRDQALDEFQLEGTPSFYINGKQLTGDKTLEQLAAEIDPLVPADFKPPEPASSDAMAPAETPMAPSADAMAPNGMAVDGGAMAPAVPEGGSMAVEPNAMAAEPVAPAQ